MTHVDIVFDGPPDHNAGRFVEVEDAAGKSINFGQWVKRDDGYWVLRITRDDMPAKPDTRTDEQKEYDFWLGHLVLP